MKFTIKSVVSAVKPWDIEAEVDRSASVNGHHMQPGDRIVVRGVIQEGSALRVFREYAIELRGKPEIMTFGSLAVLKAESSFNVFHYEVTLDWDGSRLTAFPEERYALQSLDRIQAYV